MTNRTDRIRLKAASALAIEEDTLKNFFPNTSEAFWRSFQTLYSYRWDAVRGALLEARNERQSSPKSGISRTKNWIPIDCGNALKILEAGHLTNGEPRLSHDEDGEPRLSHDIKREVINLTDEREDDEPVPMGSNCSFFILQLRESTFTIYNDSLSTLRPGAWLNDQIVNGALRLLQEVTDNKVLVVDSVEEQLAIQVDFGSTKFLLPMLIHGNHWVLGAYVENAGLLVYDSLPSRANRDAILRRTDGFLTKISQTTGNAPPDVMITSPLLQTNLHDCGVFAIIAAFHETIDLRIKPLQTDATLWRDVLCRLLSPRPDADDVPVETQPVEFPVLPKKARLADAPDHLIRCFDELYDRGSRDSNTKDRRLAAAELVLEIIRHCKERALSTGVADALVRFELVERYCKVEVGRLRKEREVLQMIRSLRKVVRETAAEARAIISDLAETPQPAPRNKRKLEELPEGADVEI